MKPTKNISKILFMGLALFMMLVSVRNLAEISKSDPWTHNLDMDVCNAVDSLLINSGIRPGADQPGLVMKSLLAMDYRIRHRLGYLDVWNLGGLDAQPNPLTAIPNLISAGREHSRILVSAFIAMVGVVIFVLCRSVKMAALGVIFVAGSSGLMFHGLLVRPELLCTLLGQVLALACIWCGIQAGFRPWGGLWFAAAGLCAGFAILEKLPGLLYLFIYCTWVIGDALVQKTLVNVAGPSSKRLPGWRKDLSCILILVGATVGFVLFLDRHSGEIKPFQVTRLLLISGALAGGAFLIYLPLFEKLGHGLQVSLRRFLLLGSGAMVSLPLSYLFLWPTMGKSAASNYLAQVVRVIISPTETIKAYASNTKVFSEFIKFIAHNPWLYAFASLATIIIWIFVKGRYRLRVACTFLLITALGVAMMMAKRYWAPQYIIFTQVPALLVIILCLHLIYESYVVGWRPRWAFLFWAGISSGACAWTVINIQELNSWYPKYQSGYLTEISCQVDMLYSSGIYPSDYLSLMKKHYGSADSFQKKLRDLLQVNAK